MSLIASDLEILIRITMEKDKAASNSPNELALERLMERIIGRMIDINYHIIVSSGGLAPKDYHESFLELGKMGILTTAFATEIARSAGLRNRLAHEYDEIDPQKILEAAAVAVLNVPRYLAAIEEILSR